MCLPKRFLQWVTLFVLMAVSGLIIVPPFIVQGAPLLQGTVTPRPSVAPTTFSSPIQGEPEHGEPIHSEIELALTVDKAQALPGELVSYRLQISNVAGRVVTNVWLTCDLPDGIEVQEAKSSQGEIHNYGHRISVELGSLQPAFDSQFVTIDARIRDDVAPGARLVHRANLTSDQAGGGKRSVETLVLGGVPTATPENKVALKLPVTGSDSIPLWLVVILGGFIVLVALVGLRERWERTN